MSRGDGREGPHAELYRSAEWKKVRKIVLERDPRCRIGGRKCTFVSTEVDHIIPVSRGGPRFALSNLRGSCAKCNRGRRYVVPEETDPSKYAGLHREGDDLCRCGEPGYPSRHW